MLNGINDLRLKLGNKADIREAQQSVVGLLATFQRPATEAVKGFSELSGSIQYFSDFGSQILRREGFLDEIDSIFQHPMASNDFRWIA